MRVPSRLGCLAAIAFLAGTAAAEPAERETPTTQDRHAQGGDAHDHGDAPTRYPEHPALPADMSLDEVLERADQPPPDDFPDPVMDDEPWAFLLIEQLEYRVQPDGRDELGWEGQGWIGFDYDKLWVKTEGESPCDGRDEGESDIDLLYSRLITPFWNAQVGVQYANDWEGDDYRDRWSGAVSLQGLAPGTFELDASVYVSDDGDVTAAIEGEYNLRLTQRLVFQPRVELGFAAQDVSERELGAGMTDANLDLRLRYEIEREIAPYLGLRYRVLVGETGDRAEASGGDDDAFFVSAGLRLAF